MITVINPEIVMLVILLSSAIIATSYAIKVLINITIEDIKTKKLFGIITILLIIIGIVAILLITIIHD